MTSSTENMLQALTSPEGTDRRQAALALGAGTDASVVPALIERILVEDSSCVREDLTWALVQHAEAASPALLEMARSQDAGERRTAAHVISKVGNPEHFGHVVGLVADEHADVAIKGYRAATNTGGAAALEALAARLGDGDLLQRDALTNAFHRVGSASVPVLVAGLRSESSAVREHVAEALGHLGEEAAEAAAALEAAVTDADQAVRVAVVAALGQLGDASAEALDRLSVGADPLVAAMAKGYLRA